MVAGLLRKCLLVIAIGAAFLAGVVAAAPPPRAPAPSEPPSQLLGRDCLLAGVVTDAPELCRLAGEALAAADGRSGAERLLGRLGERLHNPDMAGVDLSKPIRFFYMNPQRYRRPWVYQFEVSDAAALKRAMASQDPDDGLLLLRVNGSRATAFFDPAAGKAVMRPGEAGPAEVTFHTTGQLRLRANVQQILLVFADQVAEQAQLMKDRMREAMQRLPAPGDADAEALRAQQELDLCITLLGQVREAECGLELKANSAGMFLLAEPLPGSLLAGLMASQAQGSLAPLRRCPQDAILIYGGNLRTGNLLWNLIPRALGIGRSVTGSDCAVLALLPSSGPGSLLDVVALRDGAGGAGRALARWRQLCEPGPETDHRPFGLRPVPPDATPEGVLMAEVIPNQQVLGAAATNAMRVIFGSKALAALERGDWGSALAVGRDPLARIRQIRELATDGSASLRFNDAFVRTMDGVPEKANLLLYVAPEGIRRWLVLGGVRTDSLSPIRMGMVCAARFSRNQALAAFRLPTRPIREALLSRREEPAPPPMLSEVK